LRGDDTRTKLGGMVVENRAGVGEMDLAMIARAVDGHRTLEDVVRWGLACVPPRIVADVVTQDEFTHDVVVPYGDGLYLVYDTT
jgi:hypothetical protein